MINVNVEESKKYISRLSKLLSSYKLNHGKIEYEYNNMILNWKNNKNPKFFALVNDNQLKNIKLISNLENQIKTLNRVVEKYEELGNKIKCSLDDKDYILAKFNNIEKKIDNIIIKFNSLGNISFYENRFNIFSEKEKLKKRKEEIIIIKDKINTKYKKVRIIENDLSSVLSNNSSETMENNLNYSSKKYTDYFEFDVDKIRISNGKLKAFFKDQDSLINDIKTNFIELCKYYKSDNFNEIFDYNNEVVFAQLKQVQKTNIKFNKDVEDICNDYSHMIKENINNLESL